LVKTVMMMIREDVTQGVTALPLRRNLIPRFRKERECKKMTKDKRNMGTVGKS
jgi:hypothetical protein